jgi:hypothetical protein
VVVFLRFGAPILGSEEAMARGLQWAGRAWAASGTGHDERRWCDLRMLLLGAMQGGHYAREATRG